MEDCIFCKILAGEIPSQKVYEDGVVLAFLDVNPSSPGHTVVVPKRHAQNVFELSKEELGDYMQRVEKVARMIKDSELAPDGMNIGVNQFKAAGQMVDHLHVHIIPRWEGDGGKDIQSVVSNSTEEELPEVLKKIIK